MKISHDQLENIFVTSDHHFGHSNIIQYCDRPFVDVDEMDRELVRRWNNTVPPNGVVFHLGDFCLGDINEADAFLRQLNGQINIITLTWHHDKRWLPYIDGYSRSKSNHPINLLGQEYVIDVTGFGKHPIGIHMSHYPLAEWDRKHYGAIHLHGHSHGNHLGDYHLTGELCFDVGVDSRNSTYAPLRLSEITALKRRYYCPHCGDDRTEKARLWIPSLDLAFCNEDHCHQWFNNDKGE